MRHQYTPIFRDVLTSRIWAQPPATRAVWLWLVLSADPEGFIPATLSGVAIGAHVTESEARVALEVLESQDPDAELDDPHQGAFIAKVARGWFILRFEEDRERARYEAQKARNRRYMQRYRAGLTAHANDTGEPQPPKVDVPKPIPKTKPDLSEEISPPTPRVVFVPPQHDEGPMPEPSPAMVAGSRTVDPGSYVMAPPVLHRIPADWFISEAMLADAKMAGVAEPARWFAKLKLGPIGGTRGIFADELESYIRGQFGTWRTWEEADRAKAADAKRKPWEPAPEPEAPKPERVKGMPVWVRDAHVTFTSMHGMNLKAEAQAFSKGHHIPPRNLKPNDAAEAFTHWLLRRQQEAA